MANAKLFCVHHPAIGVIYLNCMLAMETQSLFGFWSCITAMALLLRGHNEANNCFITVTNFYFECTHNVRLQTHLKCTRGVSQLPVSIYGGKTVASPVLFPNEISLFIFIIVKIFVTAKAIDTDQQCTNIGCNFCR